MKEKTNVKNFQICLTKPDHFEGVLFTDLYPLKDFSVCLQLTLFLVLSADESEHVHGGLRCPSVLLSPL